MCSCQHITILPSRWIKALVRKHLHRSRSEQSLSIMYNTWWAGRALSVWSVPSVALVLCDSITDRRHLLSHRSLHRVSTRSLFSSSITLPSRRPQCAAFPLPCPEPLGLLYNLMQLSPFLKEICLQLYPQPSILSFMSPLNCSTGGFLYDAFMQNASVWLNVGLTALLII